MGGNFHQEKTFFFVENTIFIRSYHCFVLTRNLIESASTIGNNRCIYFHFNFNSEIYSWQQPGI